MVKKFPNAADDTKVFGTTAETGDTNYMPMERVWYRPTLEINGMQGGYTAVEGFSKCYSRDPPCAGSVADWCIFCLALRNH